MKSSLFLNLAVAASILLAGGCCAAHHHDMEMMHEHDIAMPTRAVAVITPTKGNEISGLVTFTQEGQERVHVVADIAGLAPNSTHGFHIHEYGDIRDDKGLDTGGHYNPENQPHGLPGDGPCQAGDLGNITADAAGKAHLDMTFGDISVCGKNPILGRAVVIHALRDDGTGKTGNAGGRIAVGVIGIAK